MISKYDTFKEECKSSIALQGSDLDFKKITQQWFKESIKHR